MALTSSIKEPSKAIMEQQVLPLAFVRGQAVVEKPQDLFIPPDALEVILESFEGPLDLLLYLIKKQKFDILSLPIAPITTQYMHYVELMKELNMELASEYLVMAALLAEIKSRLLLPKQHQQDDEEDPRAELVRKLKEYQVIKQAALDMDSLPRMERDIISAKACLPAKRVLPQTAVDVQLEDLVSALQAVMKRVKAFEHHHIAKESLSTRERMTEIINRLHQLPEQEFIEFNQLFNITEGRHGVVVTFLAILELIKESVIDCRQLINNQDTAQGEQTRLYLRLKNQGGTLE